VLFFCPFYTHFWDPAIFHPTAWIALLLPASFCDYGYVCRLLAPSFFPLLFLLFIFSSYLFTSPDHTAAALCIDMSAGFGREN
jgi:hypothetical protein